MKYYYSHFRAGWTNCLICALDFRICTRPLLPFVIVILGGAGDIFFLYICYLQGIVRTYIFTRRRYIIEYFLLYTPAYSANGVDEKHMRGLDFSKKKMEKKKTVFQPQVRLNFNVFPGNTVVSLNMHGRTLIGILVEHPQNTHFTISFQKGRFTFINFLTGDGN